MGGRQSAFEWAALLREAGAATVHVAYRHDTPALEPSDWSWVAGLMERTRSEIGWYRRLPDEEKQAIAHRMWMEGRRSSSPGCGQTSDGNFVLALMSEGAADQAAQTGLAGLVIRSAPHSSTRPRRNIPPRLLA